MNKIVSILVVMVVYSSFVLGITLPDEVAVSFRRCGQRIPQHEELYGEQKSFVDYVTKNWRQITENIESLPPIDGEEYEKVLRFNSSVTRLGYVCGQLNPTEYLDFFESVIALCEQKRISFTAFRNVYYGADIKLNFWSVNWEHPRVQKIFDRIRKFDPPPDEDFLSALEDEASGKLADHYMVSRSDGDPLPQTLPGIKLQRPFASLIPKFEALTGKRVAADPNFPDHNRRLSKKNLRESEIGPVAENAASVTKPWWSSAGFVITLGVCILLVVFRFRSWIRHH